MERTPVGGIARAAQNVYDRSERLLGRSWIIWAGALAVYAVVAYVLLNRVRLPSMMHLIVFLMAAAIMTLTLIRVEWGLLGLVMMIPFARPGFTLGDMEIFHISGFNVALVGVWIVHLIRYLTDRDIAAKGPLVRRSPIDVVAIVFLILATMSSMANLNFNANAEARVRILMRYKELVLYFAWFYLAFTLLRRPADVRRFALAFGLSGVLVAVVGLHGRLVGSIASAGVVTEAEVQGGVIGGRAGAVGVRGWFGLGHPNLFASFLIMSMPFWFYAVNHLRKLAQKIAVIFVVLLGAMAVFFTYSRSAWAGLVMSMTALATRDPRELRTLILLLVLVAVVAQTLSVTLIGIGVVDAVATRFEELRRSGYSMRPQIFVAAFEIIRDRPLTGVGMGAFSHHSSVPVVHAHNLFLTYAAELGLPSAAAFVILVGIVFAMAARNLRMSTVPAYGFVADGTFVALFAALALSQFEHTFFDRNVGYAFFALLAIIASYDRMVRERRLPGMEAAEYEPPSALWTD